jgi:hypothetical protein
MKELLGTLLRCAPAYGVRKVFLHVSCGTTSQPFGRDTPCGLSAQVMPCYVSFPHEITMLSAQESFCCLPTLAGQSAGGGEGEAGEVKSVPFSITAFWSCGDSLTLLRVAVSPWQRFLLFRSRAMSAMPRDFGDPQRPTRPFSSFC